MRKLGLDRTQLGFLKDDDSVTQIESLLDRANKAVNGQLGDSKTGTVTIDKMIVGEAISVIYGASGGALTVNLPTEGTYNVMATVTVDNTFTTSPSVKVGRGVTGVVAVVASGSTLYATLTRIT